MYLGAQRPERDQYDVFISYSWNDRAFADKVVQLHRLLAWDNAANPGQGGEVYVQIQFAVAEQCGALQNGTRCLRPFQHRQG